MTSFLSLLPTSLLPPTNLLTLVPRAMAQTTVRNLKKSMNESYQSKYLVTGRIIYFYKKNPSGYFPQVLRKTYHPATRYSRFLRNFIPINQTI